MSGHHPWREIRRDPKEDPAREARVAEHRAAIHTAIKLAELRRERGKTQTEMAAEIGISQKRVSKIEHTGNPELDTLRAYIRALGGELEVLAVFPDRSVSFSTG
jgi:DNA-binding XRE family transcriptional regulator